MAMSMTSVSFPWNDFQIQVKGRSKSSKAVPLSSLGVVPISIM